MCKAVNFFLFSQPRPTSPTSYTPQLFLFRHAAPPLRHGGDTRPRVRSKRASKRTILRKRSSPERQDIAQQTCAKAVISIGDGLSIFIRTRA